MTIKQGKDIDNDVFWGRVSELMGGKRGRQQCRIKWHARPRTNRENLTDLSVGRTLCVKLLRTRDENRDGTNRMDTSSFISSHHIHHHMYLADFLQSGLVERSR